MIRQLSAMKAQRSKRSKLEQLQSEVSRQRDEARKIVQSKVAEVVALMQDNDKTCRWEFNRRAERDLMDFVDGPVGSSSPYQGARRVYFYDYYSTYFNSIDPFDDDEAVQVYDG